MTGLATTFGSGAMTNSINEIEHSQVILVSGSNTTKAHPQVARRIYDAVDRGAKLIVIDPCATPVSRLAHLHLALKPGSDIPLLNAMMRVILDENLVDEPFIEMRTENYHQLRDMLYRLDLEEAVRLTRVPLAAIAQAARLYARSRNAVICYCLGVTQHVCGTDNVQTMANLAMLTGNIEKENSGVDPLRGQNNVQGACDMGTMPGIFPGYQAVADPGLREKFSRAWKTELSAIPGLTLTEMTHNRGAQPVRAMYIMGENPMLSDPDLSQVRANLEGLEFLAVSDLFLTETAALADVVFPAASFAEKSGTFTNTERRVQMVRQAIPPLAGCRPDSAIISALSARLGYPLEYESAAEVMEEVALLAPIYGGIYHDRLESAELQGAGLQWPCPDRAHPGTPFLHKYNFTRGKGRFNPTRHTPPSEEVSPEYPFILITGRDYHHYHTGTMTRRSAQLQREHPEPFLALNPEDARALAIRTGELLRLSSRRGTITLKARISPEMPRGSVFTTFHFTEAPVNFLTLATVDPQAKCPEFKICAVAIAKSEAP